MKRLTPLLLILGLFLVACDTNSPGGAASRPLYMTVNMSGASLTFQNVSNVTGNGSSGNYSPPIPQTDVSGLVQALADITTNASQNYTVIVNNSGNITVLQGNVTSLLQMILNVSGNLSTNQTAWTTNDTNLYNLIASVNGSLPDITGKAGMVLTNNGSVALWAANSSAAAGNVTGNFTVSENISAGNIFLNVIGDVKQYLLNLSGNISANLASLTQSIADVTGNLTAHIIRNDNPHNVTAQQVGAAPTAGNSSIVTVGNITSGIWSGTAIADLYIASATYWNAHVQSSSNPHNTTAQQVGAAPTAGNSSIVTVGTVSTGNWTANISKTALDANVGFNLTQDVCEVIMPAFSPNITVTAQNNTKVYTFGSKINAHNITSVWAGVSTNSTSGNITVNIFSIRLNAIIAIVFIDANEATSYTATNSTVIYSANSGLQTGDQIRLDVIYAGTGAKGLSVGFDAVRP